jgi:hypothetical protein
MANTLTIRYQQDVSQFLSSDLYGDMLNVHRAHRRHRHHDLKPTACDRFSRVRQLRRALGIEFIQQGSHVIALAIAAKADKEKGFSVCLERSQTTGVHELCPVVFTRA